LEGIVLFIHIIVCLLLVIIVLLQSGKSADLAGAFGGMGSQSTFGPRGTATFLSKMTTTLAVLFMVTSLTLWIMAAKKANTQSVLGTDSEGAKQEQTTQVPAATEEKATDTEQQPATETKAETTPETKKEAPAETENQEASQQEGTENK